MEQILDDGTIVAATRRGKRNRLKPDDPMLKRANRLHRNRFAALPEPAQESAIGVPQT